tara:strand:+ start:1324 stop:1452 length:129 start_codon:yes stop_codon:yes gene_type:complete
MKRSYRFNYKGVRGTVIYPEVISKAEALLRLTGKFGEGVKVI